MPEPLSHGYEFRPVSRRLAEIGIGNFSDRFLDAESGRVVAFTLRPDDGKAFHVFVSEDRDQMHGLMSALEGETGRHDFSAACISVRMAGREDLIGFLFFNRMEMGSGTVAHEIAHAAFRFLERDGGKVRHWRNGGHFSKNVPWWRRIWYSHDGLKSEERYAVVVETMTRQFWSEMYRIGVIR